MLFDTIPRGEASNGEQVQDAITDVLDELGLRRTIVELGLHYQVGTGGSRLSEAQRQKMAIAIAVLKRPDLIAFNDATTALDSEIEAAILRRLKDEFVGRSCFAVCTALASPLLSIKSWSWSKAALSTRDASPNCRRRETLWRR